MDLRIGALLGVIIILNLTSQGYGLRTKHKMFIKVNAINTCFRKLNATHQIGCSSKWGGSKGVVHLIETASDIDFILKNGSAGPYVPVMPLSLLNVQTISSLKKSSKISGLIIFQNNETLNHFSHERTCPNVRYGLNNTCGEDTVVWNEYGTGLAFQDIPFPMVYTDSYKDIDNIRDCFHRFNNFSFETQRDRSLCSLFVDSLMQATTDTPTCIRRSNLVTNLNPRAVCDPLGDLNIWASLFPFRPKKNNTDKIEYIFVSTRADTSSLFYAKTPGADSAITGLVTLFSTANLLNRMIKAASITQTTKNVIFTLLNGESFDYIGSQRLLYDMDHKNFPFYSSEAKSEFSPIKFENISLFIELNQLSKTDGVYGHTLKENAKVTKFMNVMSAYSKDIHLQPSPGTMPPSSAHTFLKRDANFPALVLTNHNASYKNMFYHSILDDAENVDFMYTKNDTDFALNKNLQKHVFDISLALARSLFEEVTSEDWKGYGATDDEMIEMINEMFYCYLDTPNCKIFQAVDKMKFADIPLNIYVGVSAMNVPPNYITNLNGLVLGWLLGTVVGESNANCTGDSKNHYFRYYNITTDMNNLNATKCYRLSMNFTDAVSPAFIIPDYDWSSNKYSSWSESRWDGVSAKLFLKPSAAHENMTIAIGSMTMIFSFIVVYFVKSRSHILFNPLVCTTDSPGIDC